MYKKIVVLLVIMACCIQYGLKAFVLRCPETPAKIEIDALSQELLTFYKEQCGLEPNLETGFLEPLFIPAPKPVSTSKVAMRAPGINSFNGGNYY